MQNETRTDVVAVREYSFICPHCGGRHLHRCTPAQLDSERVERIIRKIDAVGDTVEGWAATHGGEPVRTDCDGRGFVCADCNARWYSVDELFVKNALRVTEDPQKTLETARAAHLEGLHLAENGVRNGYFSRGNIRYRQFYREMFMGALYAQGYGMVDISKMRESVLEAEIKAALV